MTIPTTPQAKITDKSVRIIIDIPDATNFAWERAHSLWKDNFKESTVGTASRAATNGLLLGYTWYKVNPRTNKFVGKPPVGSTVFANMMPMPGVGNVSIAIEDLDAIFADLYKKLNQLETTIYRLKTTNDPKAIITASDKAELINDVAAIRSDAATSKEMLK